MRRSVGVLLTLAGAGIGLYALQRTDGDLLATERLAATVRVVTEASRISRPGDELPASRPPALPASPQVHRVAETGARPGQDRSAQNARPPVAAPAESQTGAGQWPPAPVAQRPPVADGAPERRFTSVKPADEGTKRELTKSIQAELRRVGCFDGDIDGSWSTSSRQAMKRFTDRVNATLPIDQPDYILLTLLQGHEDRACGKVCPAGQVAANDGRCQPRAIIAQEERKQSKQAQRATKATVPIAATATAEPHKAAAAQTAASDAQIIQDRAREAARLKEQQALEERQARLAAEKAQRQRAADEQRAKAEQAAEDLRRKQLLALEQRKTQGQARAEAERVAKAWAIDEQRARAELAAYEARRSQEATEVQRKARVEARLAAERQAAADLAARRQAQRLEAEKGRTPAALSAQPTTPAARTTAGETAKVPDQSSSATATERVPNTATAASETVQHASEVPRSAHGDGSAGAIVSPPRKQRAAVPAPEPREEVRAIPRGVPRDQPRFVQRFYPPPYYVGRLSALPQPVFVPAPVFVQGRPARSFRNRIFHDLGRNSP